MMSSQFSYELDERQIRLMMQDAELEYNDALWNKFDSMASVESRSSNTIGNFIPAFNINISRSVIVPVLFVVLIGGLSAMLFSFVDFKKKETVDKEIPLVANPNNIKKPEITPVKNSKPLIKTQIAKVIDTASKVSSTPSMTSTETPVVLAPEKKKEDTVKLPEEKPKEIITSDILKKEPVHKPEQRKKVRKVRTEILPIINATTNLNEGVTEPELDLK